MGLTRPQAIAERLNAASVGLDGAIRQLARMLAIVDYERDEDIRVFGFSRNPEEHYAQLREAARQAVADARGRTQRKSGRPSFTTAGTTVVFKTFAGETTAVFAEVLTSGKTPCFSCRDGHFEAPVADIDEWPHAEPTRRLLTELADNFWPA